LPNQTRWWKPTGEINPLVATSERPAPYSGLPAGRQAARRKRSPCARYIGCGRPALGHRNPARLQRRHALSQPLYFQHLYGHFYSHFLKYLVKPFTGIDAGEAICVPDHISGVRGSCRVRLPPGPRRYCHLLLGHPHRLLRRRLPPGCP
jgi:hypothetical protein